MFKSYKEQLQERAALINFSLEKAMKQRESLPWKKRYTIYEDQLIYAIAQLKGELNYISRMIAEQN